MQGDIFDKIGKKTPYKVPEKYLENFTYEMMKHYEHNRPRFKLRYFVKYAATVAAVLIIMVVPGYIFFIDSHKTDTLNVKSEFPLESDLNKSIQKLSDEELIVLTSLLESDIYKDQL